MEDNPTEVSRPLLIFNHNAKAGGGSIVETLREFKPRETTCGDKKRAKSKSNKPRTKPMRAKSDGAEVSKTYGSSCGAKEYTDALSEEHGGVDEVLFYVREPAGTTRLDRLHGFVIGSIREPCSQYLSLWSFGSNGYGGFRRYLEEPELYGVSKPYFNTTSDKERFRAWMKHPAVAGIVGRRVKDSYGESALDAVDCWVFVEDFRDSLLRCLRMYADQGGFVDWQAPTVSSLLRQGNKTNKMSLPHNKSGDKRSKNDPLGDPRSSHHRKCEGMFDVMTARLVEVTTESFIYDLFGYEGCCRPGTNFHPRRDNEDPTKYDGEGEYTANSTGSFHLDIVKNALPFDPSNGTTIASSAQITGVLLVTFNLFLRRRRGKSANSGVAAYIVQSAKTDFSSTKDQNLLNKDEMWNPAPGEGDEMPLG